MYFCKLGNKLECKPISRDNRNNKNDCIYKNQYTV